MFPSFCGRLVGTALLASSLMGCNYTTSVTNSEEDRKPAELVTDSFLMNQKQGRRDANLRLFGEEMWETTSREKVRQLWARRDTLLGPLVHTELGPWQTQVVKGTNPSSNYVLQYKSKYAKGSALETFTLEREADDSIKIVGYNISLDAL
ncbi:DUF4019 domain-containing protein [Hymenobacter cellulosilyticus]|uniref:DUF4019 domain-containing protein n=1 Tax=Hymenobacter cellulosilyticus TaxID=2932248 RepID=A0A8T9Q9R7_9BACT|nr:DUF4019 domain-containing protein [Hymenobacter cellulosilyticus]UOQ73722.1 DUF4019 domain-containing protein [Hymenobacter cellulosilyticus]